MVSVREFEKRRKIKGGASSREIERMVDRLDVIIKTLRAQDQLTPLNQSPPARKERPAR